MGRYVNGLILLFITIGVNSQDEIDAEAPADYYTVSKAGICEMCVCEQAKVDCQERNFDSFFSLDEWRSLTDIKPTKVDLSFNYMTTISAMADLPIKELNISYNRIESIDNGAFRELQNLTVLDLSNNRLTSGLSPHVFEGHYSPEMYLPLANMRVLNLAFNRFHSLDQDLFEHLPELTSLDLTGNPLTTIDQRMLIAISSLPMLKELRLRDCQLSEIPDKLFHAPRFLERLDLSANLLTSLPPALEECKNLIYLNLNQNLIKELQTTSFPRLPKLKELHMCNMPELTSIGSGALGGLQRLAILHLSFNPKLTEIHPNALAEYDETVYGFYSPIVKELYLQSNNLSKIERRLVLRWDLVEKMDISRNPFRCDCSTQWMVEDLVTVLESMQVNGSDALVCQEPEEMRGYTMRQLHNMPRRMDCSMEPPEANNVMIRFEEDEVTNGPEVDEVADDPKVDEVADDPKVDEVADDPKVDEVADDPKVDEVADDPKVDEVADDPKVDEVADDPKVDEVADGPEVDDLADGPELDDLADEPEEDEVTNGPEVDGVMIQPELDRVIVPSTYIGILPWLFLAGPTLLALMLYRRRKASQGYDKLALAEENYI